MDSDRLRADVEELYDGVAAYDGLPHAQRVLSLAQRLSSVYPSRAEILLPACLLHAVASDTAAPGVSSARIARAYLQGVGTDDTLIRQVSQAIEGTDWTGQGEPRQPGTDEGLVLWHADQLDLLSVERHVDFLAETPLSGAARERHLRAYKHHYVCAALQVRSRLWLPGSAELYDELLLPLARFLDDLATLRLTRLPAQLHYLVEGLPEPETRLLPSAWRRLPEVATIRKGVRQLLAGEDPKAVKASMPPPGLPYQEFREEQRLTIRASHDAIFTLAQQRITASQLVAAEKYFSGDTLHKPRIEDNLFREAQRRGAQLGLEPGTAEDLARLLLAKAREVQERTLNQIAVKLSEAHREILDAERVRAGEGDTEIPSLVVLSGDQPLAREDQLIKELRLTGLNEAYPRERAAFARWFDEPHPYFIKGLIVGARDNDLFLQALFEKERCKVIASFTPTGDMHVGQGALVSLLAYYQRLGAEIVIAFNDLEMLRRDLASPAKADGVESLRELADRSSARAREAMHRFLLRFAALGLDIERVDAYRQLDRQEVLDLAAELGCRVRVNVLNSALGLRMNDSVASALSPLMHVADILHQQTPKYGGPCRTLVLSGLERDVYVRMARNIADEFGFEKPSSLYLRMMRSLSNYEDPRTGATVQVMKGAIAKGALFYSDDADAIRRKIRAAVTGGRESADEQRQKGGNPDPRVCSVSSLLAFHGIPDPVAYEEVRGACRAGTLLCGECKANAERCMVEYVANQQQRLSALPPPLLARTRELVGPTSEHAE